MTVRNILLTLAKEKKFDKDAFVKKLNEISGLNEKQWKDNCKALIKQIEKTIKGRNILIGRYICRYEKMLNDKSLLDKKQKNLYKKEIRRLEREKMNFAISEKDAIEMLSMEGYLVTKEGKNLSNDMMLNVLKHHFGNMNSEDKRKFSDKLKEYFPME